MSGLKQLKKLGITVALAGTFTFVAPMVEPVTNQAIVVNAATTKLSKSKLSLIIGQETKLKVQGTKANVKWSSSDKKIATVSKTGKVTAKGYGSTVITAKVGSKKYKCKIDVKAFKEEKLEFDCGATFVIPKGWISVNGSISGIERYVIAEDMSSTSYVDMRVCEEGEMTQEKFIESIKDSLSQENQQKLLTQQLQKEVTVKDYNQEIAINDDVSYIITKMDLVLDANTPVEVLIYDYYDGSHLYEIIGFNTFDSDINIVEYTKQIATNIKYIKAE